MGTPSARERLTATAAAKTLTAGTYLAATSAVITVEDGAVRFTLDGTAPDNATDGAAEVGHLRLAGDVIILTNRHEVVGFRFIRHIVATPILEVTYGAGDVA